MNIILLLAVVMGVQIPKATTEQATSFQRLGGRCESVWAVAMKAAEKVGNKDVTTAVVTFTPADGRFFSRVCHLTKAPANTLSDLYIVRDAEETAVAVWRLRSKDVWVVSPVAIKAGADLTATPVLDKIETQSRVDVILAWFQEPGDRTILSVGPMMGRK